MNSNEFIQLTNSIKRRLPVGYLFGILGSYLINAILIISFLTPILSAALELSITQTLFITAPGAIIVQFFRFLIVFTDQLLEEGKSSALLVQFVAHAMTLWGLAEAWHLVSSLEGQTPSEFWSVYGFAGSIIIAGYILEINFVKKANQLKSLDLAARQSEFLAINQSLRQLEEDNALKAQRIKDLKDQLKSSDEKKRNGHEVLDRVPLVKLS